MEMLENIVSGTWNAIKKGVAGLVLLGTLSTPIYANDFANGEEQYSFLKCKAKLTTKWESKPIPGINYAKGRFADRLREIAASGIKEKNEAKFSEQLEIEDRVSNIILVYSAFVYDVPLSVMAEAGFNLTPIPDHEILNSPEIQVKINSGYTQLRTKDTPIEDYQLGNVYVVKLDKGFIYDGLAVEIKKTSALSTEERETIEKCVEYTGCCGDTTLSNRRKLHPHHKTLVYYFQGEGIKGIKATRLQTNQQITEGSCGKCGVYFLKPIEKISYWKYNGFVEQELER